MGKNMKKTLSLVMAGALILGISTPDANAAAKMKLNKKKVTINVGEKTVLKVKKAKKKAKWSVKSGKKVITLSKKKKASVTITGKKAGKAVVQAKIGKKKLTCKVTVTNAVKESAVTTAPATTEAPAVVPTIQPTASPVVTEAPTTVPTVTPTVEPEPTPPGFVYEGLDTSWIDSTKPMVAFTFDDGPGANGMAIQELLVNAGAHATFFYIGSNMESDKGEEEVLSAVANGFEVGNHSNNFSPLNEKDAEDFDEYVGETNRILTSITGFSKFLFRAPELKYSDTMYENIAAPFIHCAVDTKDYLDATTVEDVVSAATGAKDGDIVLMHVNQSKTLQALPSILDYYVEQGIQIVSVSELFAVRGEALADGVQYSSCPPASN